MYKILLRPTLIYVIEFKTLKLKLNKLNLWLTAPKGATPVNYTSETDWHIMTG